MLRALLASLIVALTFGCASMQTPEGQAAAARIGVQYATLKYVGEDAGKAQRVVDVADTAISLAETGTVPIDVLEQQVREAIPWSDLDLADRQLVELLILQVRAELDARVVDGQVDPERAGDAVEVLKWVRDAASLAASQ